MMRIVHTLPLASMRGGTYAGTETTSSESYPQARASAPPLRNFCLSLLTGCLVLVHWDTLCVSHNIWSLGRELSPSAGLLVFTPLCLRGNSAFLAFPILAAELVEDVDQLFVLDTVRRHLAIGVLKQYQGVASHVVSEVPVHA